MTSKMLYVADMKTESELADVYLDFIRKCSIPSALRRENAKFDMSQRIKDIHIDLIIADRWTQSHSPWQNRHMIKYCWIGQVHQIIYGF
jgi:hypothetical protein